MSKLKLFISSTFILSIGALLVALILAYSDRVAKDALSIVVVIALGLLCVAMILTAILLMRDLYRNGGKKSSPKAQAVLDLLFYIFLGH